MGDMTQAQTSERERLIASLLDSALEKANDYDCESNVFDEEKAADMLRADAEKIRALRELASGFLVCLAHVRLAGNIAEAKRLATDAFDWADKMGLRESLALTQSPRSEAGEA